MATYTGLIIIPTAETVAPDEYDIELESGGRLPERSINATIFNSEIGIGSRFETGVDYILKGDTPSRALFNAKYKAATWGCGRGAAAIGVHTVGHNLDSRQYVVASQGLECVNAHLGLIGKNGHEHWFVGLDKPIGKHWMLMADFTSGEESFSSVGAEYHLNDRLTLQAGMLFPNGDEDALFLFNIILTGPYKSEKGK